MPGTTYQPFDSDRPGETSNAAGEPSSRSVLVRVGQIVVAVVAVLFLGLLVYGVLAKASDTAIDDQLSTGQAPPAPAVALPVLDRGSLPPGVTARLSSGLADGRLTSTELHGTPFILNFWAVLVPTMPRRGSGAAAWVAGEQWSRPGARPGHAGSQR